ncbi:probable hexosyltransferase MUCI70 [Phragmites australis]|uniref:probable hexosyltransferase MUCI70 n=1 Tax=Phragmites australis TaxID=29695 RepID=UPI002D7832A5|nr:probable hexosyltransferase MUCI70 [Phragmites australis]
MPSSSSLIHGISISVSDDDEATGKVRVRVRRKRHRAPVPAAARRRILLLRAARLGAPLLLASLAVSLLLYESYRLGPSQSHSSLPPPADADLSRLSRAARAADGATKSCLKILDPEKLQSLELPGTPETNKPIKEVVYRSSLPHIEDDISLHTENSRFNSFTGYQTLTEREESFKIKESVMVHCGFYSESGGFRVSDVDKEYMRSCSVVVATCAFGGGDDLHQPVGMTEESIRKVCYVAFWDEVTRAAQEEEGNKIGEDLMIGLWRIILVSNLPFSDQRLNGKIPKLISHRLFPMARYSIWVDSKSQFRRDPLGVLEAVLWRSNSSLALSEHGARSSLYDEAKAIVKKHKATPEEVKVQLDQYRQDGIPDEKRFHGKKALAEASVIVRDHTPLTNLFMCLWFNEVVRFTSRDQLSFPYVLRRLSPPGVHLFPVCARKDLVYSFGHKRKVKPLVKEAR